jgi:hypothetical protein
VVVSQVSVLQLANQSLYSASVNHKHQQQQLLKVAKKKVLAERTQKNTNHKLTLSP